MRFSDWRKGLIFERNKELIGYYIKLGNNTFIEVFKGDPGSVDNINHLAIETDDIDQVITSLHSNGFDATNKKPGGE